MGVGVADGDERPDPVGAEFADVDGVAGTAESGEGAEVADGEQTPAPTWEQK